MLKIENFFKKIKIVPETNKKEDEKLYQKNIDDSFLERENEIEKDEKDYQVLNHWNNEINQMMGGLNCENKIYIDPKQVHFFQDNPLKQLSGNFDITSGDISIYINHGDLQKYKTSLHEMIHYAATKRLYKNINHNNENVRVNYGGGLGIDNYKIDFNGNQKHESFFKKINEAVTEKITQEIFLKNTEYIEEVSGNKNIKIESSYSNYIEILDNLLKIIKEKSNDNNDPWDELKKAYFEGDLSIFAKFGKIYGKDLSKLLLTLENLDDRYIDYNYFLEILQEEDIEKRKEMIERLEKKATEF